MRINLGRFCVFLALTIHCPAFSNFDSDPDGVVHGVNVISGDYISVEEDMIIPGPDPIVVMSRYREGSWFLFPHTRAAIVETVPRRTRRVDGETVSAVTAALIQESGAVLSLRGWCCFNRVRAQEKYFVHIRTLKRGWVNTASGLPSGKTHPRNIQMTYDETIGQFRVTLGGGTERFYEVCQPVADAWFGEEALCADLDPSIARINLRLGRETLPSGNEMHYEYEDGGHLTKISLRCGDEELAGLVLAYGDGKVSLTSSRAPGVEYRFQDGRLVGASGPRLSSRSYEYDPRGRLQAVVGPGKASTKLVRHVDGRVTAVLITGNDTQEFLQVAGFAYQEHKATVSCVGEPRRVYQWDSNCRLQTISVMSEAGLLRRHRKYWGHLASERMNLVAETIEGPNEEIVSHRSYEYDSFGNVERIYWSGLLTGEQRESLQVSERGELLNPDGVDRDVRTFRYSTDKFNNLVEEIGVKYNKIVYEYGPGTDRLLSRTLFVDDRPQTSTRWRYDPAGRRIYQRCAGHNGSLDEVSWNRIHLWEYDCFGNPTVCADGYEEDGAVACLGSWHQTFDDWGNVLTRTQKLANGDVVSRVSWVRNQAGWPIRFTDREGNEISIEYDCMGNVVRESCERLAYECCCAYSAAGHLCCREETRGGETRRWIWVYDRCGALVSRTDWRGANWEYQRNQDGQIDAIIGPQVRGLDGQPARPVWSFSYDVLGRLTAVTDPLGFKSSAVLNLRGDPVVTHRSDGSVERRRYDAEGTLHRLQTSPCRATEFGYDQSGTMTTATVYRLPKTGNRVASECSLRWENRDAKTFAFRRNSWSAVSYERDPAGRIATEFRMVKKIVNGRTLSEEVPTHRIQYDFGDRVAAISSSAQNDGQGFWQRYEYDTVGRIAGVRFVDVEGELVKYSIGYESTGQIASVVRTDPNGKHTQLSAQHSQWGDLTEVTGDRTEPAQFSHVVRTSEDGIVMQEITRQRPDGSRLVYLRDLLGRLVEVTAYDIDDVMLSRQVLDYDLAGNCIRRTFGVDHELPLTVDYRLDPIGRVIGINDSRGWECECEYQEGEKLPYRLTTGRNGEIRLSYERGQLSEIRTKEIRHEFRYYDEFLPFVHAKTQDGVTIARTYDRQERMCFEVVSDTCGDDYTLQFTHDNANRLVSIVLPDQTKIFYDYDALHCTGIRRLDAQDQLRYQHQYVEYDQYDRPSCERLPGYSGERVSERDLRGRLKSIKSSVLDAEVLEADVLGRPQTISTKFETGDCHTQHFEYDPAGNLIRDGPTRRAYNSVGELTSLDGNIVKTAPMGGVQSADDIVYEYDDRGRPVCRRNGMLEWAFEWNALDQLVRVEGPEGVSARYIYGPLGRKLARVLSTGQIERYVHIGPLCIGILDERGRFYSLKIPHNEGGRLTERSVAVELEQTPYCLCHDLLGNVAALVDVEFGEIVEAYRYTAFGKETIFDEMGEEIEESDYGNSWRYREKYFDPIVQMVDFGFRFLDPVTGVWISPDPAGFTDGPNRHAFSYNNPIEFFDQYGLSAEESSSSRLDELVFSSDSWTVGGCPCTRRGRRERGCQRGGGLSDLSSDLSTGASRINMFAGDFLEGMVAADYAFLGAIPEVGVGNRNYPGRSLVQRIAPHLDVVFQLNDSLEQEERTLLIQRGLIHAGGFMLSSALTVQAAAASFVPGFGLAVVAGTTAVKASCHASAAVLKCGPTLGSGTARLAKASHFVPTPPSMVKGWKVGDPITHLTRQGNVPKWSTVRRRYWKNEALFSPEHYNPENVERMKRGLAPQRWSPERELWESKELHHAPPQRSGGLFDIAPVWPDEHAVIDEFRCLGGS